MDTPTDRSLHTIGALHSLAAQRAKLGLLCCAFQRFAQVLA